ncbi:MAG: hypothetical protein Q9170_008107 [Blastenia crenularia]
MRGEENSLGFNDTDLAIDDTDLAIDDTGPGFDNTASESGNGSVDDGKDVLQQPNESNTIANSSEIARPDPTTDCYEADQWIKGTAIDLDAAAAAATFTKLSTFLSKVEKYKDGAETSINWQKHSIPLSVQQNSNDCGVHAITCMFYLAVSEDIPAFLDCDLWRMLMEALFSQKQQELPPVAEDHKDPTPLLQPPPSEWRSASMALLDSIRNIRRKHASNIDLLQRRLESVTSAILVFSKLHDQLNSQLRHNDPAPVRKELDMLKTIERQISSLTVQTKTVYSLP